MDKAADSRILTVRRAIAALGDLSPQDRIEAYNSITIAAAAIVSDICSDPVLAIQIIDAKDLEDNDYNPNHTANQEMDLLETSIREDGVTMPVVTARNRATGKNVVVDGFHRKRTLVHRMMRRYIPCSVILHESLDHRMAATVRHNRARGKHQVALMGELVRALALAEWDDDKIARHMGMSSEELLRLKQVVGAARLLAAKEYGPAWHGNDGPSGLEEADAHAVTPSAPLPMAKRRRKT